MPIYRSAQRRRFVQGVLVIGVLAAALSAIELAERGKASPFLPAILVFWTIGAPTWFFVEYMWIFDNKDDENAFRQFRDLQGLAAKIWAGVLALLTALYLKG